MINKIIKYSYLGLGIIHYFVINYMSYFIEPYSVSVPIGLKITFSIISLLMLIVIYILILKPTIFTKKEITKDFTIVLYVGVIMVSLISLIN